MTTKKVGFLDIETTNLNASMGRVMVVGVKGLHDSKVTIYKQTDIEGWNATPATILQDKKLLQKALPHLEEFDEIVTWYGLKFDVPFLNTRLLINQLPVIPPQRHLDLCRVSQKKLKFQSNRLGAVLEDLGMLPKTSEPKKVWQLAQIGHAASINKLAAYCENDVLRLEDVYHRLLPMYNYTIGGKTGKDGWGNEVCAACGHHHLKSDGIRYDNIGPYRRLKCVACGHNQRGRKIP
ncbi:MAG: ribonuclease H-like domain-containing protein [Burkholderiaceae bacterium]